MNLLVLIRFWFWYITWPWDHSPRITEIFWESLGGKNLPWIKSEWGYYYG